MPTFQLIPYTTGFKNFVLDQEWQNDPHYWILLDDTYVPDLAHDTVSDVSSAELSGGGYVAKDMTGESTARTGNTHILHAAAVQWTSATFTAVWAVVCAGTVAGKSGTDAILGYAKVNLTVSAGTLTLTPDSVEGLLQYQVRAGGFDLIEDSQIGDDNLSGSTGPGKYSQRRILPLMRARSKGDIGAAPFVESDNIECGDI